MRFNLHRLVVPALLVLAVLLVAPAPAAAAPWTLGSLFESSWGAFVGWSGNMVRHLWAEEGVSIDPLGRPAVATPAANDGRHLWAEEGVSIDPLGRTAPASVTGGDGQ